MSTTKQNSPNHPLCKGCQHSWKHTKQREFEMENWCYMFTRGDHLESQGNWCGQFKPLALAPAKPNDPAVEAMLSWASEVNSALAYQMKPPYPHKISLLNKLEVMQKEFAGRGLFNSQKADIVTDEAATCSECKWTAHWPPDGGMSCYSQTYDTPEDVASWVRLLLEKGKPSVTVTKDSMCENQKVPMSKTKACFRDGKWHADELANLADKLEREVESLTRMLGAKERAIDELIAANENIITSAPLTDSQKSHLAGYVTEYLNRDVRGTWYELATGIAALMADNDRLRNALIEARKQLLWRNGLCRDSDRKAAIAINVALSSNDQAEL